MPNKTLMSRSAFEKLITHLVKIEEEKKFILQDYFPGALKERREIEDLLNNYIAEIESLIANNIEVAENADNRLPFVTIYSEVQVQDVDTFETCHYHILPPLQNSGENNASFLSPVGKSLLLSSVGDKVLIETPGGILSYRIQSIKFKPYY